jgi:hypothetical protein
VFELAIAFDALPDIQRYAATLTTAELRSALEKLLGFTADNLLRMAVVVAELESRGEDLSDLKLGILPILREIAAGRLLPAVVVQFAGQPGVIKQIAKRSREDQELIVTGVLPAPRPTGTPPGVQSGAAARRFTAGNMGAGRHQLHRPPPGVAADPDADPDADDDAGPQPDVPQLGIAGIAATGNPRDVGEMAADMVLKCREAGVALGRFADRLADAGALPRAVAEAVKAAAPAIKPRRPFWEADAE